MAWWLRGLVAAAVALAPSGCSSSGHDDSGAAGSSGGSTFKNVYIGSITVTPGAPNCLPRPLVVGDSGKLEGSTGGCYIVEARPKAPDCTCDAAHGRASLPVGSPIPSNAREFLRNSSSCDQTGLPACTDFCFCEIVQFSGDELRVCQTSVTDPGSQYGVCYLDDQYDLDGNGVPDVNPELLASCPDTEKRMLRFMGSDVPASDGRPFIACL
jgi:hypothetical protein